MSSNIQQLDVKLTIGSDFWPPSPSLNFTRMNSGMPGSFATPSPPPEPARVLTPELTAPNPLAVAPETPATSARPQRAAKRRAIENIRNIQQWEGCPESSDLFRRVERRFNEELSNEILTHEEREQVEQSEIPQGSEAVQTEHEENWTESSEEESPTASLRDFIVTDDEDVPDDASFEACSEAEDEDGSEAGSEESTASEGEDATAEEDDASEGDETQEY